ncbi:hypothetical protein U1701_01480 [Sphingomonas sp. PB2P19]|uniref:hypothetical protein n=1 Tax=Sphingomonas rhamnosi TaxID=3096156 RepID=UPI002FC8CD94
MKPVVDEQEKLGDAGGPPERGYDAWKRAKIERGLAQSRDRSAMIPVEQVLRDLS